MVKHKLKHCANYTRLLLKPNKEMKWIKFFFISFPFLSNFIFTLFIVFYFIHTYQIQPNNLNYFLKRYIYI